MQERLPFIETLVEGVTIGLKNVASLIVAALLYVLTCWVPYINVGTSIAMASIPGRLAKGEIISPLFIFDAQYRKDFSSYILVQAFVFICVLVGFIAFGITGIVIALSLSLAQYIVVDDDETPLQAIKLSNRATNGFKWKIFFIELVFTAIICIVGGIFYLIPVVGTLLNIALIVCLLPFSLGITAVIYRELYMKRKSELNDPNAPAVQPQPQAPQPQLEA